MMFGIPNAVIAKGFRGLGGVDTISKTLRDVTALYHAREIKHREGNCHEMRMTAERVEING